MKLCTRCQRRAEGLCVCGAKRAEGRTLCAECLRYKRESMRDTRAQERERSAKFMRRAAQDAVLDKLLEARR